jgi:transposase
MVVGVAEGYRRVDRDQVFLFPPDMREWLPPGHRVWLVIEVVERHLDTSAFHAGRRTGGAGAAGYDPDMLVTVLVWAYANGVTSSRRMEQLCGTDVAFRLICAGNLPDHATIARFRGAFAGAVPVFFAQVLGLCARLGMGRLGVVALDGMKIAASASKAANRTEGKLAGLASEIVARHAKTDAAEDELFGDGRGDEVPEGAWRPGSRDERIGAALASLQAEREAVEEAQQAQVEAFRARQRAGRRTGCSPDSAAVVLAGEKLARVTAAQQAKIDGWEERNARSLAQTGTRVGNPPRRPAAQHVRVRQAAARLERATQRQAEATRRAADRAGNRKGPGPVRNLTDPDSPLMPVRGGGFVQGYNAQNVTSSDGLIIATELTTDPAGCTWFEPMARAAEDAAALITASRPTTGQDAARIGLMLADAGYCSEHNLTISGPDRLIATGKLAGLTRAARSGGAAGRQRAGPATQAMARRLTTEDSITAYRQRGHIAETPHGHIKHNLRFRQLSMRGKANATAEWAFTAAVHNLLKAITSGHLTTQALAAPPA